LTRVLIDQEKFGESETLLGEVLTPAFIREPASADLLIRRVDLRGRQGRWTEAAADAALALEYQPAEHYRYHTLASLLAINCDRPAYLQLCQRLSAQFPNPTNPYVAERVAQDCLLEPDAPVDLHWVDRLADTAVSAGSGEVEYPYFQACKAMACYRLGYYPEAIAWATKATLSSLPDARAKAYAVSAMAHWQLGQKEAARSLLTKGDALAPRLPPKDNSVNLGDLWVAWLQARISLDEAARLIQPAHS
jgi:tetratricopeptide (TPR) repeat protein